MAEVMGFFMIKLANNSLTTKASAMAFNFFLAIFPTFIFLFALIPYIPVEGLDKTILTFFEGTIPANAYETIRGTLEDILVIKRGGLLSFGIVVALYFASNGFSALFSAFDPQESFWVNKLKALIMVFVVSFMLLITIALRVFAENAVFFLGEQFPQLELEKSSVFLVQSISFALIFLLTYFTVALVVYVGTPKHKRLTFFSPAASLSTVSILLVSYAFGYYVENFGRYNQLYGSLGALIVTMLWMYFCAISLQIWYVYNESHHRFK